MKYKIRNNVSVTVGQYEFIHHERVEDYRVSHEYTKLDREIGRLWQEEWAQSATGHMAKRFFPRVMYGNMPKWYNPDMHTLFILSGYGSINGTLFTRGATVNPNCPECTFIEETVEHILFPFPLYTNFRYRELSEGNLQSDLQTLIKTKKLYFKLSKFAGQVLARRNS